MPLRQPELMKMRLILWAIVTLVMLSAGMGLVWYHGHA